MTPKHIHVVNELCPTCGTVAEGAGPEDREDW